MDNKSDIIEEACQYIHNNNLDQAKKLIMDKYPFQTIKRVGRNYSDYQALQVFLRDGFIDRYSGKKLIFPGTLKVLSNLMQEEMPYHRNWKMDECHIAFWELVPTIDHVLPISRGGFDEESNWVTTSFIRNTAKSNFTLEELDWEVFPAGDIKNWDGLLSFFLEMVNTNQELLYDSYILRWYRIVKKINN